MSNEDYKVTIGEDIFSVKAEDNLSAKYEAASQFRTKYGLTDEVSLTEIVEFARAKLVTPFEPTTTTEKVLKALKNRR
jgi:hypothetical protein